VFLAIMRELYRICRPDALVRIAVPHPRHEDFISDPTHVRPITAATLRLFDRKLNDAWAEAGLSNTPLAHHLGVDFETVEEAITLVEPFYGRLQSGELSREQVHDMLARQNNIASELRFGLRARKPYGAGGAAG
jgi:hypothetical protein